MCISTSLSERPRFLWTEKSDSQFYAWFPIPTPGGWRRKHRAVCFVCFCVKMERFTWPGGVGGGQNQHWGRLLHFSCLLLHLCDTEPWWPKCVAGSYELWSLRTVTSLRAINKASSNASAQTHKRRHERNEEKNKLAEGGTYANKNTSTVTLWIMQQLTAWWKCRLCTWSGVNI